MNALERRALEETVHNPDAARAEIARLTAALKQAAAEIARLTAALRQAAAERDAARQDAGQLATQLACYHALVHMWNSHPGDLKGCNKQICYDAEQALAAHAAATGKQLAQIIAAHRAPAQTPLSPQIWRPPLTTDSAQPYVVIDPAQAHTAELEMELKHIQEMAAEDIRMGDASGAIWQIEAQARALLSKIDGERKAVTR